MRRSAGTPYGTRHFTSSQDIHSFAKSKPQRSIINSRLSSSSHQDRLLAGDLSRKEVLSPRSFSAVRLCADFTKLYFKM
jgi:hypothetical protein